MVLTSAKRVGAFLLLAIYLTPSALGNDFEKVKENTHAAVEAAKATAWAHFKDMDNNWARLPTNNQRFSTLRDDRWKEVYHNQSPAQKAHDQVHLDRHNLIFDHERHFRDIDDHHREKEAEALQNYNGLIGKYSSAYPFNHIKKNWSGTDKSYLQALDKHVEEHRKNLKDM